MGFAFSKVNLFSRQLCVWGVFLAALSGGFGLSRCDNKHGRQQIARCCNSCNTYRCQRAGATGATPCVRTTCAAAYGLMPTYWVPLAQSFWYSDQSQHILATQRFYQAVDTLAVDDLDALLSPGYVAVFGAGVHARCPKRTNSTCMMGGDCRGGATFGGAKHNDGDGKLTCSRRRFRLLPPTRLPRKSSKSAIRECQNNF